MSTLVLSLISNKGVEAKTKFLVAAWETEEVQAFFANGPLTWCRLLICVCQERCTALLKFVKESFCMLRTHYYIKSVGNSAHSPPQKNKPDPLQSQIAICIKHVDAGLVRLWGSENAVADHQFL